MLFVPIPVARARSGSTEKIAYAVGEGKQVEGTAIEIKASETKLQDLRNADGIIIGSPTYYG